MIEPSTAMYTSLVLAVICLIYSIVMVLVKKLFTNVEEDYKKLKTGQNSGMSNDQEAFLATIIIGADQRAKAFQSACDRVSKETIALFGLQSFSAAVAGIIFSVSFLLWFSVADQFVWFLIPFWVGLVVAALSTLYVLVLSTRSRTRVMISAQQDKETVFSDGFIVSTAITSGVLAFFFLSLLFVIPFLQTVYFDSFAEKDNAKNFLYNTLAFTVGMSLASVFYRDLGSTFSKGVTIGSETLDETLKNLETNQGASANNNLKYGQMIGNTFSTNVTSTLDLLCLISSMIAATLLLTEAKDKANETVLYIVLCLMSLSTLVTLLVSWANKLLQETFKGQATSQYVASQIRVQYIIVNIICFLILFFLPVELIPAKLSLGKDGAKTPSFFDSEISRGDLVWCLQIGQFIAFMLVFIFEAWTSYGFSLVRKISNKLQRSSLSEGVVSAESQGGLATALLVFLLGVSLFLAYYFGGVFGLNWITIGILQTAPTLLGVCFFSASANDAVVLAQLNRLDHLVNRLRLVNWASNNFAGFVQLLNIAGGFFINLLCVAVIIFQSETQKSGAFDGSSLLGLLLGFSLIYLLKSINQNGILNISSSLIENSNLVKTKKFDESSLSSLNQLISKKFTPSFFSVLFNLASIIGVVLFTALVLGKSAVVGLALGLTIFGAITSLNQIIVGTSLKNAQNFIDQSAMISGEIEAKKTVSQSKESGFFAHVLHSVPGTGILNYVHFTLLLLAIGAKVFKDFGYLDAYMQKSSSDISGATVDWYLDLLGESSGASASSTTPAAAPAAAAPSA